MTQNELLFVIVASLVLAGAALLFVVEKLIPKFYYAVLLLTITLQLLSFHRIQEVFFQNDPKVRLTGTIYFLICCGIVIGVKWVWSLTRRTPR